MNGNLFPPIGQRQRMQFRTIDVDGTLRTYSRGCTIVKGDFIIVRVPLDQDGVENRAKLDDDERRFVEENITPGEWAEARRLTDACTHVPGGTEEEEAAG
jgi:hypothetical protein